MNSNHRNTTNGFNSRHSIPNEFVGLLRKLKSMKTVSHVRTGAYFASRRPKSNRQPQIKINSYDMSSQSFIGSLVGDLYEMHIRISVAGRNIKTFCTQEAVDYIYTGE